MKSLPASRPWLAVLGALIAAALSVALLLDTKVLWFGGSGPLPIPEVHEPKAAGRSSSSGAAIGPASAVPPAEAKPRSDAAPVDASSGSALASQTPPAGVTAEQWAQARLALAEHPHREAELARLAGYLQFQNRFARFQALRSQAKGSSAELTALAQALDSALPERLARRELSASEARLLKVALLQTLQPDEALRSQSLAAWTLGEAQQAAARQPPPDERDKLWQQRQAEATAAWVAQPEAQRDPKALEARLQALREQIYGPGG